MSNQITVPQNGSFVYATATGNYTSYGTNYTIVDFLILVDAGTANQKASPGDFTASYTTATQNAYQMFSWTVNGLFNNLTPGPHTIGVYAANCGYTNIAIGAQSGATLTGMVLNN
jgi:hypothetical protein